ncbi:MAG: glycogen/starch/alpha-glucan phosphorylase [Magnetospirillum sp. WYHS-4]
MDERTDRLMEQHVDACLTDDELDKFSSVDGAKCAMINAIIHVIGKDPSRATKRDWFYVLAHLLRGAMSERNIRTARTYYKKDVKRVYYLSMEYLIGRSLGKVLADLGVDGVVRQALQEFGVDLSEVEEFEFDAALGNGGLGRLAACFLDSLATHEYPGFGYGIRYEYGMFTQRIENGQQVEHPENWLRYGNPWEIERPNVLYPVRFGGRILRFKNSRGEDDSQWIDTDEVMAMAFDMPVSGYASNTVGNLRLWSARSSRDFDLRYFNEGNYIDAVKNKTNSENLSKVLYPNDKTQIGQELRLKQEYFFVSASVQDIVSRYLRYHEGFDEFADKVAMQLNDTHPTLAVPELMRILMDEKGLPFDRAFEITRHTFSYTNHTLLPEALETWPISMLAAVLPRHLEIMYLINDAFLKMVRRAYPGDPAILKRVSLVDDDRRAIRMAHVAVVASHKVNGVAALHTELLRKTLFSDFDRIYPGKFINQTNGITPRRWLLQANPGLSALITDAIGDGWAKDLAQLEGLVPLAKDKAFREKFIAVKAANKQRLHEMLRHCVRDGGVDVESMFDVHVKRIHEYKRQLLNVLHVIARYNRLRDNPEVEMVPRTVIFAGKAAPGYDMAKLIVRLVNDVSETINHDPLVGDKLKVIFVPDYRVTAAEVIIPGSDLSQQISTAGTEASGTGNMKFALNGALTIGTLDGANIEIREEVGPENIFIFGLTADQAREIRIHGYDPWQYYNGNEDLRRALDMIGNGYFSPDDLGRYRILYDVLLRHGDYFLLLADYASYAACQEQVDRVYADRHEWARRAILNVAKMGKFSSDRTIHGYAKEIWGVKPLRM